MSASSTSRVEQLDALVQSLRAANSQLESQLVSVSAEADATKRAELARSIQAENDKIVKENDTKQKSAEESQAPVVSSPAVVASSLSQSPSLSMAVLSSAQKMPDSAGMFGEYGGSFLPPHLQAAMDAVSAAYLEIRQREDFQSELAQLYSDYVGRPSPIFHAKRLSEQLGGAQIHLKREDLNHTGAHKINHCLGEALLAKYMNKKKVIAETGAGQHGVALATACALVGIPCEIHMGAVDVAKEHPNVVKMKILGCKLVTVTKGAATLKEAVDSAFDVYMEDPVNCLYAIGSVVGPAPFPAMVRDFQSIIGTEARGQFLTRHGRLPDYVSACVGGGSNAIGIMSAFLGDASVNLVGVEPAGEGLDTQGRHSATLTKGKKGTLHGMACYILSEADGTPSAVHSIASGLSYPGCGPQHCMLKDTGRVKYETASDKETLDAFMTLSRVEGIIPALESAHAVAWAMRVAPTMSKDTHILINLSGRGDKDVDYVAGIMNIH